MADPLCGSEIVAAYDEWAEVYDEEANRTRDLAATVLRRAPLDLSGRRLLEIGCGTGANTVWLAERAASVLAVDFSWQMLRRARARLQSSRVGFVQHDIRAPWPIASGAVHVVIAMLVLEHVDHLPPVFAESARVLSAGGAMFLGELHPLRQREGRQAEFTHPRTGTRVRVAAFRHETADYVAAGRAAGLEVVDVGDWRDADAPATALPRLLSLHLHRC